MNSYYYSISVKILSENFTLWMFSNGLDILKKIKITEDYKIIRFWHMNCTTILSLRPKEACMKKFGHFTIVLVGFFVLSFAGGTSTSAFANGATDGGSPISDVLTVYDRAGTIVGQVGVTEDGTVFGINAAVFIQNGTAGEDPYAIYYINDVNLPIPLAKRDMYGFPTNMWEPSGEWSDTFGVANLGEDTEGPFVLAFSSDTDTVPPVFAVAVDNLSGILEGQQPVDATKYLNLSLPEGYTATFFSDSEGKVPEPTTMFLLGSGLLGLWGARKKFKK
jgi:hypothetical protein